MDHESDGIDVHLILSGNTVQKTAATACSKDFSQVPNWHFPIQAASCRLALAVSFPETGGTLAVARSRNSLAVSAAAVRLRRPEPLMIRLCGAAGVGGCTLSCRLITGCVEGNSGCVAEMELRLRMEYEAGPCSGQAANGGRPT